MREEETTMRGFDEGDEYREGFTQMELFAASALQGMLANCGRALLEGIGEKREDGFKYLADICFKIARAMCAESEKIQ
jgi:hypothetical protein